MKAIRPPLFMDIRGVVGGASGHSDRLFIRNRGSMQGQDEDGYEDVSVEAVR